MCTKQIELSVGRWSLLDTKRNNFYMHIRVLPYMRRYIYFICNNFFFFLKKQVIDGGFPSNNIYIYICWYKNTIKKKMEGKMERDS